MPTNAPAAEPRPEPTNEPTYSPEARYDTAFPMLTGSPFTTWSTILKPTVKPAESATFFTENDSFKAVPAALPAAVVVSLPHL